MAKLKKFFRDITEEIPAAIAEFGKGVKVGRDIGGGAGKLTEQLSALTFMSKLRSLQKSARTEAVSTRKEAERVGAKKELGRAVTTAEQIRKGTLRIPGPEGLRPVTPTELPDILRRGTAATISRFPERRAEISAVRRGLLPAKAERGVFTVAKIETVIGDLETRGAGGAFDLPFDTRKDAEDHLIRSLGRNWETILPKAKVQEIKEVLDREYGALEFGEGFGTSTNIQIMTDANGNRAEVEVDARGKPIRVIRELQ